MGLRPWLREGKDEPIAGGETTQPVYERCASSGGGANVKEPAPGVGDGYIGNQDAGDAVLVLDVDGCVVQRASTVKNEVEPPRPRAPVEDGSRAFGAQPFNRKVARQVGIAVE